MAGILGTPFWGRLDGPPRNTPYCPSWAYLWLCHFSLTLKASWWKMRVSMETLYTLDDGGQPENGDWFPCGRSDRHDDVQW
jgi:hypothetical protein